MSMFKAYLPTQNKQCKIKFKDKDANELYTFEQVKDLPEYAGLIAEGYILIDVDDFEQSETLLDIIEEKDIRCRVYQTTRGKHFVFKSDLKKTGTHLKLACGLEADIKSGYKNGYEVLKYDNKERVILYDILENEEYQELPKWLYPIKTTVDFLNMEEGDGRNQSLFNYILTLQGNGFTKEEAKETIEIINQYVLKQPLSNRELKQITRDDAFKKELFFNGQSFLFDKFATFLKNNNNIIKINNRLHIYKDGVYVEGYKYIEQAMIEHIPNLNRTKRSEVIAYLELLFHDNTKTSDANFIAFNNGIYNIIDDSLTPFTPSIIITNKIPYNYNPDAYYEITDKALDKVACNNEKIRMLLEEAIGYCFYRRNELRKSFMLTGEKRNGKSTFLDLVKELLGDNVSALDLAEIGDRFRTADIFGMLANIGDDISEEYLPNTAIFKKVVAGNRITVERKGQDPFTFDPYAKFLFSANNIPRIKDKTGAVLDRLIIIPFDAHFDENDPDYDPYIKYKMLNQTSMEYLINLGIKGLKRILKHNAFTTCEKIEEEKKEYDNYNNPIKMFFEEHNVENQPTKEAYINYQIFCSENGFQCMSNIEFSRQIKKQFNLEIISKKINGEKFRIFVKTP